MNKRVSFAQERPQKLARVGPHRPRKHVTLNHIVFALEPRKERKREIRRRGLIEHWGTRAPSVAACETLVCFVCLYVMERHVARKLQTKHARKGIEGTMSFRFVRLISEIVADFEIRNRVNFSDPRFFAKGEKDKKFLFNSKWILTE